MGSSNVTGGRYAFNCCAGSQLTGNGRKAFVAAVFRMVSQGIVFGWHERSSREICVIMRQNSRVIVK